MRLTVLVGLLSTTAFAQQSLFNVPSTQETVQGRLFGQVQASGTREGGEINTTLELGIFRWLEIGMNLFHMPLYTVKPLEPDAPASPTTAFNANVYFEPTSFLAIECGIQAGIGLVPQLQTLTPVLSGWATMRLEAPGRFGSYVFGAYAGNQAALGRGPPAGGLFGLEVPLVEHLLHAQGDWVIGLNQTSVAVVGLVLFIGKNFQVSAGAQLPSPFSGNDFGAVLELTFVPSAPSDGKIIGDPKDRAQQKIDD